jgi:hypothetical protein
MDFQVSSSNGVNVPLITRLGRKNEGSTLSIGAGGEHRPVELSQTTTAAQRKGMHTFLLRSQVSTDDFVLQVTRAVFGNHQKLRVIRESDSTVLSPT